MEKIILASGSPRRRELLEQAGVRFTVMPGKGQEKIAGSQPEKVVEELAAQKCREIFLQTSGEVLVIGADTLVASQGKILGKPGSKEEAFDMLSGLQGKGHQVYTGVALMARTGEEEKIRIFHQSTEVVFYPMSSEEIREYIATGEPMDKAGAYGIQGKCAVFVKEIRGDYNNVVGLPLARLYQELKAMGIRFKEW